MNLEQSVLNALLFNPSVSFSSCRMESTEKCEVVIQHFNGKYLKTPPGIPGQPPLLYMTLASRLSFLSWKIILF